MTLFFRALALSLLPSLPGLSHAIELPDGFVDEPFISGLDGQITGFDPRVPGRIFISEKAGIVKLFVDGQLLPEPFLDISDIVNDRVDRGMLSVAVHPQFPQSPHVYVLYTYDPVELVTNNLAGAGVQDGNGNRVSRLARYTADASQNFNVVLPGSETIILGKNSTFNAIGNPEDQFDTLNPSCGPIGNPVPDCMPSDEITHTIGALRFADDGTLFVTNGDGASFRSANPLSQMTYDLNSMRGKIMRIDPDTGLGLPDNPFFDGDPASNRSRVISYGLRNPYSMALDPVSGVPYVGEVGEDVWEEINGGAGRNFGWPCYEGGPNGNLRQTDFEDQPFCQQIYQSNDTITPPLISWPHDGDGNAAMLGDFYYSQVFPEQYMGKLFYGDFIKGWLRYADVSDPQNVTVNDFATGMLPMVEMRTGDDGALYYASIVSGEIRRIRYVGDDGGSATPPEPVSNPDPLPDSGTGSGSDPGQMVEPAVSVGGLLSLWSAFSLLCLLGVRRLPAAKCHCRS